MVEIATTPTEELILEVLAARHRTGEARWTFDRNATVTRALGSLADKGLVGSKSGIVEDTCLAWLTAAGKSRQLDPGYTPPGTRVRRVADGPTLTPSVRFTPERTSVSIDRRLDVDGAFPVDAHLPPREPFTPVDSSLWVRLDTDGTGRWSAYLWGADDGTGRVRESAQFDGPVHDGQIVTYVPPPPWVLAELDAMLVEATAKAALLS